MANTLLTTSKITFEALEILENMLGFSKHVNRAYDDQFAVSGAKIGATLNVRKPTRYTVGTGPVIEPQASVETYVPVTLTTQANVAMAFTSADLALSMDDFKQRIIAPAMAAIANKIDYDGLSAMSAVTHNAVGTPGQLIGTPTSAQAIAAILAAGQRLDEEAAPMDEDRYMVISPATNTGIVQAHSSLFNNPTKISRQFDKGYVADSVLGFNFVRDQNVIAHTATGLSAAKTNTVNGTPGATLTVQSDATTPYTLAVNNIGANIAAGTSVTFGSVYAVNPQSRVSTGQLKNFVVAEAYTSGDTSIKILPYPVFSGPFQNVYSSTGAFVNNATITSLQGYGANAYPVNLAFHKNAYTLACADLPLPQGNGEAARASSKAAGLSIRLVKGWYDALTDTHISRLDVLYGWKAIYPELACKLVG
jgi:hypothetical protein